MTQALAVRVVTRDIWQTIEAVAPAMYKSRLFGVSSVEQAAAIMLKGYELGLPLAASFEMVHVVEGKPTLSPRGALALIHGSGLLAALKIEGDADRCTVSMKRVNGVEFALTWTIVDARKAGLVKPKGAWETYPANMLRWRTIGFVADVVFPDVIGGLKRADELGAAVDLDGNVIQSEWSIAVEPPTVTVGTSIPIVIEGPAAPVAVTLDELIDRYGADAVLAANEGVVPGTDDELAAVAGRLAGFENLSA